MNPAGLVNWRQGLREMLADDAATAGADTVVVTQTFAALAGNAVHIPEN